MVLRCILLLSSDPTHVVRQRKKEEAQPTKPKMCHEDMNKLEKFLKFGTSCLKFTAYWDDRQSPSGDIHDLILYFYLCDDTIQVNKINDQGKSSILVRRQKLPKVRTTYSVLYLSQIFIGIFFLENKWFIVGWTEIELHCVECSWSRFHESQIYARPIKFRET